MGSWSRRRLLKAGLAGTGALWLPACSSRESHRRADPDFDASCAYEETLQSLMEETEDAFVPLMRALEAGVPATTLYAIAMNASARLVTAETDADMHTNSPMRAAQLLGARLSPAHQLVPLFWAWDFLVSFRPQGAPMPFPDSSQWPAPVEAAQAFELACVTRDPAGADAAIAALYASEGPDAVVGPLVRNALRPFEWLGHRAIWTAFAIRGLDDFGWDCAPWLLRSLARSIAGGADTVGPQVFDASNARLPEIPAGWRSGADDPAAVPGLLAALRTGDGPACTDAVIAALVGGASPRTVWTALALNGVELGIRWQESSFGVHQLDAVNALRNLQTHAADDETAKLCLLQAAAWAPLFRDFVDANPPEIADGIDAMTPSAGTPTPDDAFAQIATDMGEASRMLLNWLEAGGDSAALITQWSELVVARVAAGANDVHRIKYHAALLEEADAFLPEWRNRLLMGIPLRSPSSSTALWERYDEAIALALRL